MEGLELTTYKHGEWDCLCDVCGFEYKSSQLRKRWDGLMVCEKDWEERHPADSFKGKPDKQTVPWTRPDTAEAGGTDIKGNTFPPAENATAHTAVPTGTPFGNSTL